MGMATHAYQSKIALADWSPTEADAELQKWKKKLKAAFGSQGVGVGRQPAARAIGEKVNPANVPLPQTPKKVTKNVFASGEQSPYFQDSHMITPRSANRQRRLVSETQHEEHTANTHQGISRRSTTRTTRDDSSSDDDDDPFDFYGDQTTELAQQIRELTEMEVMNSTPRIELLQHRPLTQITPFRGRLDESRNSMQWLRGFVYEMKGTHSAKRVVRCVPTKSERWCGSLAPSSIQEIEANMESFDQSASTWYYRAKRIEKENIRDYLTRLNGYARNAIKFENGGRNAREHVKHFLETCGDKDLEWQLTPMQLRDIYTLEDVVSDILKVEKRVSRRESSKYSSRKDEKRYGDSRNSYGRSDNRNRTHDCSRSEPRSTRVALADATLSDLISELQ
ncbi:hypothetical protein PHMEG_00036295, partial [Phytophthora megakarya]